MLFFALFTLGYFVGVFTVLAIFPPQVKEIEEQEKDALRPVLDVTREKELEHKAKEVDVYKQPVITLS